MTKNNTTEEQIHKFANAFALQLNPSNDTMEAVRLLRKELLSLLLQERKDTLESVRGIVDGMIVDLEKRIDSGTTGAHANDWLRAYREMRNRILAAHLTTLEDNPTQDD